jgi:hypothetical protein
MKEDKRFEEPRGAPREPNLMWIGGLICAIWAVAALAVIGSSSGWLQSGGSLPVAEAEQSTEPQALANRTSCAEFGGSDLRSPAEGVWFQRNCTARSASLQERSTAECNRTALDPAEFRLVAPGLYVFTQGPASRAYLWYSSSESCFDLVSARVVTVVCTDQTVSFDWSAGACSAHGGVLASVNAR